MRRFVRSVDEDADAIARIWGREEADKRRFGEGVVFCIVVFTPVAIDTSKFNAPRSIIDLYDDSAVSVPHVAL